MSTSTNKLPLDLASRIANRLVELLQPVTDKVMIAGSIRRQKSEVGDIEIVCIPKTIQIPRRDMFGNTIGVFTRSRLVDEFILKAPNITWIKTGTSETEPLQMNTIINEATRFGSDRKYWKGYSKFRGTPFIIDLFCARQENYGVIELIRTGSREFNMKIIAQLKKQNIAIRDGQLVRLSPGTDEIYETLYCPNERDIFHYAGLPFLKPEDR